MTPKQILEDAVSRFVVCYVVDKSEQERLLRQSLGKYQDRAGLIRDQWGEGTSVPCPPHFQAVAGCSDTKRRYIPWRIEESEEGEPRIVLLADKRHKPPYCLAYFCNLRDWGLEEPLPGDCDSLLGDYLEALIAVKSVRMEREAYLSANMTEAAQALPTDQDLRTRLDELERQMQENKAISPPASMF